MFACVADYRGEEEWLKRDLAKGEGELILVAHSLERGDIAFAVERTADDENS